jgi:parallel beta-helix repeat protein
LVGLPKEIAMAATADPPVNPIDRARTARTIASFAVAMLATLAAAALTAGQVHAGGGCDLLAATGGSDDGPGTLAQPFATVGRLADALHAGQTGCVRGGVYSQDVTVTNTGSPSAPITLTSYPGERATLIGRLWIHQGADYVTVANMNLNGRNTGDLPSPDINAAHVTFTGNDVTDEHTAICFDVGSDTTYGRATDTVIQRNRVHDCGALPAANHDHGIYVESATGARILENVIYGNADRGIQLYPDAQQTTIEHNIIDANGEGIIFSGDFGAASSKNTVAHNLITNATLREDVESWYPAGNPAGRENAVTDNCVWGSAKGTIETAPTGFTATGNTIANPRYAGAASGDYRIDSTSPCAALLANTATPTRPFTTTSAITYTGAVKSRSARHRAIAAGARFHRRAHRRHARLGRGRHRKLHRHAGRHPARHHSSRHHSARRHPARHLG